MVSCSFEGSDIRLVRASFDLTSVSPTRLETLLVGGGPGAATEAQFSEPLQQLAYRVVDASSGRFTARPVTGPLVLRDGNRWVDTATMNAQHVALDLVQRHATLSFPGLSHDSGLLSFRPGDAMLKLSQEGNTLKARANDGMFETIAQDFAGSAKFITGFQLADGRFWLLMDGGHVILDEEGRRLNGVGVFQRIGPRLSTHHSSGINVVWRWASFLVCLLGVPLALAVRFRRERDVGLDAYTAGASALLLLVFWQIF